MKRPLVFAALVLAGLGTSGPAEAQDKPFDAARAAQGKRGLVWDNRHAALEPAREQLALRRLAGPVRPLESDQQPARFLALGDQLSKSIHAGSSMYSLIFTRNCTASRPSTRR